MSGVTIRQNPLIKVNPDLYQSVKIRMSLNDASHNYLHVRRVIGMALLISQEEGITDPESLLVIELAALLHDVNDHKYLSSQSEECDLMKWLEQDYSTHVIERVLTVIDHVSYSKNRDKNISLDLCSQIVQDADRLDAMGAIGCARALIYNASHNDNDGEHTISATIQHYHDKLVHLKSLINTDTGKKYAQSRHDLMVEYFTMLQTETTQFE